MKVLFVLLAMFVIVSASGSILSNETCPTRPCQNGGQCIGRVDVGNRSIISKCRCFSPYVGPFCESMLPNACDEADCGPGTCKLIKGRLDSAECHCPIGFTGAHCDEISTTCARHRCNNRGTCEKDSNSTDGFTCSCNSGFTGANCEIDIDECQSESVTCPSNMQCLDQPGGYSCICPEDSCGNGVCSSTMTGSPVCACDSGWQGDHCLDDVDECESDPCNSTETCFNSAGSYVCISQNTVPSNYMTAKEFRILMTIWYVEMIYIWVALFACAGFGLYLFYLL
uniref:EGF-like domain-containing protein n=2 Tax=Panagrellus redivivus TaxID=6233 RepID=A0A7E4W5Q3_PANRE